nr:hypothetical protein [Bosea sp. (in: a-proteobacteria)]
MSAGIHALVQDANDLNAVVLDSIEDGVGADAKAPVARAQI